MMKKALYLLLFSCCLAIPSIAQSRFVRVELPLQVSVEVPQNWWVLSGDLNATVEAGGEAAVKLAGLELPPGRTVNLFRANSMPRSTYASIAVNSKDSDVPPEIIKDATEAELKELEDATVETMKKMTVVQFLGSLGLERATISGHIATVFRYRRNGPDGPVVVSMHRLFIGKKEISFNFSYREAEGILWKPIIEYMSQSIRVGN